MTVNQELCQAVYDQVTSHPELHSQAMWESSTSCGTTYCGGGWAVVLTYPDEDITEAGRSRGYPSLAEFAGHLLGLPYIQANYLFYGTENAEAVEIFGQLAEFGRSEILERAVEGEEW